MSAFDPNRRRPADPLGLFPAAGPGAPSLEDLLLRVLPTGPSAPGGPAPPAETPWPELLKGAYGPYEPEAPSYPPIRGFGYRIPIIPEPEERVPSWSEPLGTPGQPQAQSPDYLDALADVWTSGVLPDMPAPRKKPVAVRAAAPESHESPTLQRTERPAPSPMSLAEENGRSGQPSPAIFDAGPPTDQPVDEYDMYRVLGFDPTGPSRWTTGAKNFFDRELFFGTAGQSMEATTRHFGANVDPHNNAADAFKHALWSYKLTKARNAAFAKEVTDSLEISFPGENPGDRLMDLYNNNVGRQLALDPNNDGRKDEEVILEALKQGKLQTHYFRVLPVRGQLQPPSVFKPFGSGEDR